MNSDEAQLSDDAERPHLKLLLPVPEEDLFRYGATADLLWLLVRESDRTFTHRELSRRTDHSLTAINQAIDVLEDVGWVTVDQTGHHNEVAVAPESLVKPDDPVLEIPQREFHEPVRELLDRIERELEAVEGVVLFGSVARGEADRRSDIDLFVLVSENVPSNQRRAHDIEAEFAEWESPEGERYEAHVLVDSPATVTLGDEQYERIFQNGIVLEGGDELERLRHSVLSFSGGDSDAG